MPCLREKTIAATRNSALGPFGLLTLTWRSGLYVLLGLPQVVITGDVFGQVGGNDGHQGVPHEYSRDMGAYPPQHIVKKGGSLIPLLRRGAVSPNSVLEKEKVCTLRMGCGPCQRVRIEFRPGWSTWERLPRACVAYTPV